jgi:hypothetical protein
VNDDGILAGPIDLDGPRRRPAFPPTPANPGLVVTHRDSGFTGTVVSFTPSAVRLRDQRQRIRPFLPTAGAFLVDGNAVTLTPPTVLTPRATSPTQTASGSARVAGASPRVARASRLWVEGLHDAELVEKVWGDDLRVEGVVVEPLDGADDLAAEVAAFGPGPDRQLGVLLDHLVDGPKEHRLATDVRSPHVLVRGHRFVDIWAAVRPAAIGLDQWPDVPHGEPWKEGICTRVGWRGTTAAFWRRLLRSVTSYRDLDPSLVGPVEELIDFVAPPPGDD